MKILAGICRCVKGGVSRSDESFDVLIVGGGITGAGCALDAAIRGTTGRAGRGARLRVRHIVEVVQARARRSHRTSCKCCRFSYIYYDATADDANPSPAHDLVARVLARRASVAAAADVAMLLGAELCLSPEVQRAQVTAYRTRVDESE